MNRKIGKTLAFSLSIFFLLIFITSVNAEVPILKIGVPNMTGVVVLRNYFDQQLNTTSNVVFNSTAGDGSGLTNVDPTGNSTLEIQNAIGNIWDISEVWNVTTTLVGSGEGGYSGTHNTTTLDTDLSITGNFWFELNNSDLSGNGNDGTITGGVKNVTGFVCNGTEFDGAGDYIQILNHGIWTDTNYSREMSVAFYMKPNIVGGGSTLRTIMSAGNPGDAMYIRYREDGYICHSSFLATSAGCSSQSFSNQKFIEIKWYYVVMTWTIGIDDSLIIYVDGQDETHATAGRILWQGENLNKSMKDEFTFGADHDTTAPYFNGSLDEVLFWNRTLSASEVLALNNSYTQGCTFTAGGGVVTPIHLNASLPINMYGNMINNTGDILPDADGTRSLGSSLLRWLKGWFVNLDVENDLDVGGDVEILNGNLTVGNSTDNVKITKNGINLNGTGRFQRLISLPATTAKAGSTAPTSVIVGIYPTLQFSTNPPVESVYFEGHVPSNWDEGTDITMHIHWSPTDDGGGDVVWDVDYVSTQPENNENLTASTIPLTITDSTQTNQDELLQTSNMIILGSNLEFMDVVALKVSRDTNDGADTYGSSASLVVIHLEYIANRLGGEIE